MSINRFGITRDPDPLGLKKERYGSICYPGGRNLEITSEHLEWVQWAKEALYKQAEIEQLALGKEAWHK